MPGGRPRHRTGPRAAAAVLALATTAGLALAIPLAGTALAAETGTSSQTFGYTGSPQDFTVPENATSLQVVVTGASGGTARSVGRFRARIGCRHKSVVGPAVDRAYARPLGEVGAAA